MPKLKVLDLFSGIGGFSLGLERATKEGAQYDGFETVAFCEIEEFPRKVLAKHWPDVPCYTDVRELTGERLAADGIAVDAICGGFPCQDISFAGRGAGLAGERSGLFYEIARLVGELEPRYVILENVSALLSRGIGDVLGTLASLGYDAEWHCIPASHVGAPHRRDRIWIVAYPNCLLHKGGLAGRENTSAKGRSEGCDESAREASHGQRVRVKSCSSGSLLADADSERLEGWPLAVNSGEVGPWVQQFIERRFDGKWPAWRAEPNVGRVANGVPDRAHRLKALGNAVVPQIPELIGNAILEAINV